MPSTYTLNNGIELIGTGEQSGTWGDTTNTNFELLDTALDGQVSVTLAATGSSGSPNTLPISDGASSNGRNRLVIFGDGSDLGGTAYVQLTPNDAEKIIYVRNNLSGSRSILLFQGTYNASNDYEVPAGTTAVVFFDGAGSGAVAANVFNNAHFDALNVVGSVTVGGGVTVTGTVDAGTVEFDNLSGTGAVSVTNILDEDNMASNSATALSTQQSIKAYVDSQVGTVDTLAEILANGNTTGGTDIAVSTGDDITFADSSKAIFGAGSDLQIYHDGSNSYISDQGTGNLKILGTSMNIQSAAGENYIEAVNNAHVKLFYDAAEKLATTSTGIDVTGGFTATTSGTVPTLYGGSGASQTFTLQSTSGNSNHSKILVGNTVGADNGGISFYSAGSSVATERMRISGTNGDISFYDTDGTTASFVYDASAGTTFNEAGADRDFRVESENNANALFVDAGRDRIYIGKNTSDNLGTNSVTIGGSLNTSWGASLGFENDATGGVNGFILATDDTWGIGNGFGMGFGAAGSDNFRLFMTSTEVVFNERSLDIDFRVESNNNVNAIFVDAANDHVCIGTSTDFGGILNVKTTDNTANIALGCTDTDANRGPVLDLRRDNSSAADGDRIGCIIFNADDDANIMTEYATITGFISDASNTTEDGGLLFDTATAGNPAIEKLRLGPTAAVFNEGSSNVDFRVESDSNANMLFVDAGADVVCIGTNSPDPNGGVMMVQTLNTHASGPTFQSNGTTQLWLKDSDATSNTRLWGFQNSGGALNFLYADDDKTNNFRTPMTMYRGSTGIVINEDSLDQDFRVESNSHAHFFYVDGGSNSGRGHITMGDMGATDTGNMVTISSPTTNALRAQIAQNGTAVELVCTDTDANAGPNLDLRRIATGANSDVLGVVRFMGGDNAGNTGHVYAQIVSKIEDSTSGGEDGQLNIETLVGNDAKFRLNFSSSEAVFNEGGIDSDFRVESDSNANMLFVDAGESVVRVGSSSTLHSSTTFSFEAVDLTQPGENMYIGKVPGSINNSTGFVQLFDLTYANANNVGCIFSGKMWVQSYTGFSMADFSVTKHYTSDAVHFTVTSSVDGTAGVAGASLQLVTATVGSDSFLGVKKNGGGSGIVYISAMLTGGANVAKVKEIASGSYTVTTTHGNIIA